MSAKELNIGDYVRVEIESLSIQRICKIIKIISNDFFYTDIGYFDKENIIKSSPNIIDLIEVGDYVNGGQVREIKKGYIRISGGKSIWEYLDNLKDIKSILTKEQFENMEYKL